MLAWKSKKNKGPKGPIVSTCPGQKTLYSVDAPTAFTTKAFIIIDHFKNHYKSFFFQEIESCPLTQPLY